MILKKLRLSSVLLLLVACQGGERDESATCDPGSLNCECAQGNLCLAGLECNVGVCVGSSETGDPGDGDSGDGEGEPGDGDGEPGDGDGEPGDGDGTPGDGDGTPGDGDGEPGCDPGLTDCFGNCVDLTSDDENCGFCGVECKVNEADDIGHCVQGECGNVWSNCRDANTDLASCDEVCQAEGLTCVPQGCGGLTMVWYGLLSSCQMAGSGSGSPVGCDQPMSALNDYYHCCCAQ